MDAIPVLEAVAAAQARGARCALMQRCSVAGDLTASGGAPADDLSWTQPAELSDTANEVLLQVELGGRKSFVPLLHAAESYYLANGWCQPTSKPFPALVSRRALREALDVGDGIFGRNELVVTPMPGPGLADMR
ncbi:MAG TPA: hypothetical protein VHM30_01150 [Gemmatimonadaceae bacterium]|nr:hypothetical protein [Gemmatimonadaceae bacterium]